MQTGKLIGRSVGPEGAIDISYDDNPMLNSLLYDSEFPDGQVKECSANIIAKKNAAQSRFVWLSRDHVRSNCRL